MAVGGRAAATARTMTAPDVPDAPRVMEAHDLISGAGDGKGNRNLLAWTMKMLAERDGWPSRKRRF